MASYTLVAADLLTDVIRDEIPFDTFSFSRGRNGIAGFDGVTPLKTPRYNRILRANLDRARTALYILRDGSVQWGGILWATDAAFGGEGEGDSVRCAGQGFWSYYDHRVIDATLKFVAEEQFEIVETIISLGNVYTSGDIGVTVDWDEPSGVERDRTYRSYEEKPIREAVEQLASVDDGFEFDMEVTGSLAAGFTKTLKLASHRGRRTNLVFEEGKNIRVLRWGLDGWGMVNRASAIGAGEGRKMLRAAAVDASALATFPVLQRSFSYKDVAVQRTLNGHARADLARFRRGEEHLEIEILSDHVDSQLGSFIDGDEVTVRASEGFIDVDGWYRIEDHNVSVDREGGETVKVTLSPAA